MYQSVLRAVLYALMELAKNLDGDEVLRHLTLNIPDWYGDATQRDLTLRWPHTSPSRSRPCARKRPVPPGSCGSWWSTNGPGEAGL